MGKIAKNYLYNAAYQILILLAPIVTAPYLSRVLGADNLGIYSYVNSAGNIITTVSLLGIYAYGNRQTAYIRENKKTLNNTFWELELTRLFLGICGTAVYLACSALDDRYSFYFLIYYPYVLAQFIDCSWLYVGMEDMKTTVLKNGATKLVNIAGIFLLVRKRDDVWIYILMLAVTTLIANISIYTQLYRYVGKPMVNIRRIPQHIRGSVSLFLPQVASLFYLQVDKVMLAWITGTTGQVAFYDQAEKIVTIPLSLITVISTVMMPRIANEFRKNNREIIEKFLLHAGKYAMCLAFPMMTGMICVAEDFIPWYLGNEFSPVATAIIVLSPIIVLNSLTGISGSQYFTATDQISVLMKAYVTAAVMNVAVNALLIPRYGYIGATAATVLSSLASVIIQYAYMLRQIRLKGLARSALKYFAGATVMAAVIALSSRNMDAVLGTTVFQLISGIAVYFLFLVLTKDEIIKDTVSLLKRRKAKKGDER